jgi:hypothetical protein
MSLMSRERTRGSETSQYPEEEKPKGIPPVAASEEGTAQTQTVLKPVGVAVWVSWGKNGESGRSLGKLPITLIVKFTGK